MRPSLVTCQIELDYTVYQGKDGVVFADADILSRMDFRSVLPDDDTACFDGLPAIYLHAEPLALAVPAVT